MTKFNVRAIKRTLIGSPIVSDAVLYCLFLAVVVGTLPPALVRPVVACVVLVTVIVAILLKAIVRRKRSNPDHS
jgi:hypothetical protein